MSAAFVARGTSPIPDAVRINQVQHRWHRFIPWGIGVGAGLGIAGLAKAFGSRFDKMSVTRSTPTPTPTPQTIIYNR